MAETAEDIVIVEQRIAPAELSRLVQLFFGDMVKYVVGIERRVAAVGGQLHADAEQVLLANGSRQADLWGANSYPGKAPSDCIEYTALINIRPAHENRGMEIADLAVREQVRELTFEFIGRGEALP